VIAALLGVLVAGAALVFVLAVVWLRWRVRDRRRRVDRLRARMLRRGEDDRLRRRLRLRVEVRP